MAARPAFSTWLWSLSRYLQSPVQKFMHPRSYGPFTRSNSVLVTLQEAYGLRAASMCLRVFMIFILLCAEAKEYKVRYIHPAAVHPSHEWSSHTGMGSARGGGGGAASGLCLY